MAEQISRTYLDRLSDLQIKLEQTHLLMREMSKILVRNKHKTRVKKYTFLPSHIGLSVEEYIYNYFNLIDENNNLGYNHLMPHRLGLDVELCSKIIMDQRIINSNQVKYVETKALKLHNTLWNSKTKNEKIEDFNGNGDFCIKKVSKTISTPNDKKLKIVKLFGSDSDFSDYFNDDYRTPKITKTESQANKSDDA